MLININYSLFSKKSDERHQEVSLRSLSQQQTKIAYALKCVYTQNTMRFFVRKVT